MEGKKRHGCVTAWLILMIIANSIAILGSFVVNSFGPDAPAEVFTRGNQLLLGIIAVANLAFSILLLQWKRWAFWGFLCSSSLTFVINLMSGVGIVVSLTGLIGVALLYAILQIKEQGVSAWSQLE